MTVPAPTLAASSGEPEPTQQSPEPTQQPAPQQPTPAPFPASAPPATPPATGDNWQQRHAGLQRAYDEKTRELAAAQARESDLAKRIETLTGDTTNAATVLADLTSKLETATEEIKAKDTKLARYDLIHTKFPQLAGLEGEHLLPEGNPEQLEDIFTRFSERMSIVVQEAAQKATATTTPPPPAPKGTPAPDSPQAIFKEALALQMKGDFAGYKLKMEEYHRKLELESKTSQPA